MPQSSDFFYAFKLTHTYFTKKKLGGETLDCCKHISVLCSCAYIITLCQEFFAESIVFFSFFAKGAHEMSEHSPSHSESSSESAKEHIIINRLDNVSESEEEMSSSSSSTPDPDSESKLTPENYLIADILAGVTMAVWR